MDTQTYTVSKFHHHTNTTRRTFPRLDSNFHPLILPLSAGLQPVTMESPPTETPSRQPFFTPQRTATLALLLTLITLVVVDTFTTEYTEAAIDSATDWVATNPVGGVFLFTGIYIVATVLFIPGSILTLGAGYSFARATDSVAGGVLLGSISVILGASIGATLAFVLGRYLLRDAVLNMFSEAAPVAAENAADRKSVVEPKKSNFQKYWHSLDKAMTKEGLKIMFLLRLSPIIPFNALNYLSGTTGVSITAYVVSLVGIIPGTVLFVFIGASANSLAGSSDDGDDDDEGGPSQFVTILTLVVGAVFGIAAVGVASHYAKKELNKAIAEEEEKENEV
jgi:uncharacterized membrane protein YdjX (TVP38/TMEM64 family)